MQHSHSTKFFDKSSVRGHLVDSVHKRTSTVNRKVKNSRNDNINSVKKSAITKHMNQALVAPPMVPGLNLRTVSDLKALDEMSMTPRD